MCLFKQNLDDSKNTKKNVYKNSFPEEKDNKEFSMKKTKSQKGRNFLKKIFRIEEIFL